MTTPTHIPNTGLSVVINDPRWSSTRHGDYQVNASISSYSHTKESFGGDASANLDLLVDIAAINDWWEYGIGRDVRVFDETGALTWIGFVNNVSVSTGNVVQSRGPLLEIGNRISAIYTPINYDVSPPVIGTTTSTLITENTVSQDKYGIVEKILSLGQCTPDDASYAQATALIDMANPKTSGDINLTAGSSGKASVTLDCLGYVYALQMYIYTDATVGATDVANQIGRVVLAEPNNCISSVTNGINANAYLIMRQELKNRFAYDIIQGLVALGSGTDNRMLFSVTHQLDTFDLPIVSYRGIPTKAIYDYNFASRKQAFVYSGSREEVKPWNIEAGEWVFVSDFIPGRPEATDLINDPRAKFIESITYTAPYNVSIAGSKNDKLSQILSKLTMSGGS